MLSSFSQLTFLHNSQQEIPLHSLASADCFRIAILLRLLLEMILFQLLFLFLPQAVAHFQHSVPATHLNQL
jgi:hypothetical protein